MARSLAIYGATGSRKTTQVKWFAHYIAKVTGKSTLLLSLADGGWEPMCTPEVSAGMIIPYKCDAAITPLLLLRKISQGYWPMHPKMMNEALQECAASGQPSAEASLIPIDYSQVGGIAVEGWSAISSVIMRFLPDKGISVGGEDRLKGGNMSFPQTVVVDGQFVTEQLGSNTRGDYGFVQNTLKGLVSNWNSLPVHTVMYTALEGKTTEDGDKTRATVYGPEIAGKKATAHCGEWVGDLIHAQDFSIPHKTMVPDPVTHEPVEHTVLIDTVRFYYRKHPDPDTGIIFPAKPRCAPEKVLELEKRWPGGFFEPEFGAEWGVNRYLETIDELAGDAAKVDSLKDWRVRMDEKLGRGVTR